MSCYVCDDLTTASVALTCLETGGLPADRALLTRLGEMLWAENVRSYNYRYSNRHADSVGMTFELPDAETMAKLARVPDLTKLGAVCSYVYQTCETPDWEETPAGKMAQAAKVKLQAATGTERGEGWGIEEDDLKAIAS